MAAVTASRTYRRRSAVPADLEQQLLLSYMAVFIAVLTIFAVAAHVAFTVVFEREAAERVRTMAGAADSVVDATSSGISVDLGDQALRAFDSSVEGVRWRDRSGRVVAAYGLVPGATATGQALRVFTLATDTGPPERRPVVIEAYVSEAAYARRLGFVDLSILGALFVAIVSSLVAGRWLTHRLVQNLESSMKALQDFTADAAHELRGPLTVVAANAATAVPVAGNNFLIERGAMQSITGATAQMTRVSEDLLTLARAKQSLERELFAVDLDACVANVVALYSDSARSKGVSLQATSLEPARVYGNPDQIERIVGNIVRNAVQYTPAGGIVIVECAKDRAGSRVTIADTGPGIAADDVDRVFDRFWRADRTRSQDGIGLGLTIARDLARRHGGDITVNSRPGTGSMFILTLPARPPRGFAGL